MKKIAKYCITALLFAGMLTDIFAVSGTRQVSAANKTGNEMLYYNMALSQDGTKITDQSGNGNDGIIKNTSNVSVKNNVLFMEKNGYVQLPTGMFDGKDTLTISIWLNNFSGAINTSAMFFGTTESMPVSYWLLNACNTSGRMKSVFTNSINNSAPYNTEAGISATLNTNSIKGPATSMGWNHFVTVINGNSLTAYCNGKQVGKVTLNRKVSDFGKNLVAYIGKSSYSDPTYTGFVKELKIYDKEWTADDVKAEYNLNKPSVQAEPVDTLIAQRADPYIVKGNDGYYYFTSSYPMCGGSDKEGYDRVILRRSTTIEGLSNAQEITIWDEKDSNTSHRFIWAPELHCINGTWYVFYAGSGSSSNVWDIDSRVLRCKGKDPYKDEWEEIGKCQALTEDPLKPFTGFSLDMTYFECNGKSYLIWAQSHGTSNLYMAEVDPKEPWKLKSNAMELTSPEYYWEKVNIPVNEGPSVIQHGNKIFVVYSASATGPEYCLGMLHADKTANLMDKKSWTKSPEALLTSADLVGEYGPGHNSFTVDKNGNDIFVYHARSQTCFDKECEWASNDPLYDPCRDAKVRKVLWTKDGYPILNGVSKDINTGEASTGTGSEPIVIKNVTIKFEVEGGSSVNEKSVAYNTLITAPADPTRTGYTFGGWYKEASCINAWNFSTDTATSDTTLYAKWISNPSIPTGLTAKSSSYNSIKVSWSAAPGTSRADGYEIFQSTSLKGTYRLVKTTTSTNWANKGLVTGKTYYYKIKAYRLNGTTKVYSSFSSSVNSKPVPSSPRNFAVVRHNSSSIKIGWKAVEGARGYRIYRAKSSAGTYSIVKSTKSTSFINTRLTRGKTYYYKVKAYHWEGLKKVYGPYTIVKYARP